MKKQIIFSIFILLLSGCATKKHAPETEFFAPVFNEVNVPNPPTYPNNLLSNNVTKVPKDVPVLGQAIWYEDNLIAFTGTRPRRTYIHTYTFNTKNKEFIEITDPIIKAEINRRFKNARLEWAEDSSASRTALDISMNVMEVLFAPIHTIGHADTYSKTKVYVANCSNIDGTNKIKLTKTESKTGYSRTFEASYYIDENEMSASLLADHTYLSADGSKIISGTQTEDGEGFISGVQVIDVKTGEVQNTMPIVTLNDKSSSPRLEKYFLNPSSSKLLLVYQDNKSNEPLSYSIDIVDYIDK